MSERIRGLERIQKVERIQGCSELREYGSRVLEGIRDPESIIREFDGSRGFEGSWV